MTVSAISANARTVQSGPFGLLQLTPEAFSALVAKVYQGAFEDPPWGAILTQARAALRANWVTLILRPPQRGRRALIINAGPHGVSQPDDQFAEEYAFAIDPFAGLPDSRVLSVGEVVGDAKWIESEFFRQFVGPYDIRYMIGADFRTPGKLECRLRVCRPQTEGDFTAHEKAYCEALIPHFRQAVELHASLDLVDSECTLYAAVVNRMLMGSVILDERGAIAKVNSVARDVLAESDGLRLVDGSLHAGDAVEDAKLQELVGKALGAIAGAKPPRSMDAVTITRPSGRQKLGVLVRAIPPGAWSEATCRPAVAVFVRDPERHLQALQDLLQKLFEFTPAEASLALLLARGISLDQAAAELGVRKNTVRAHLRSIFIKTNVTRQTNLVHLVLQSVATLA